MPVNGGVACVAPAPSAARATPAGASACPVATETPERSPAWASADVDEPGQNAVSVEMEGAVLLMRATGPDRVDQGPGQPDPAGIQHAVRRDYAAALQQKHQARMTDRDKARGWSGSMPWRSASSTASRCAPVRPSRGAAPGPSTPAPVRRPLAPRCRRRL